MTAFATAYRYSDRETKAEYVWRKYEPILADVLDVGADQGFLRPFIEDAGGKYVGVGYGEGVDLELDLEAGRLPYADRSFDTVLCLDTLEHLEAAHAVFDELCRVAREHVVVALPNSWAAVWHALRLGDYRPGQPLKFYGLPERPPEDRHRWFFTLSEARRFLSNNATRNHFEVVQFDTYPDTELYGTGVRQLVKRALYRRLFRSELEQLELTSSTLWCLLRRVSAGS